MPYIYWFYLFLEVIDPLPMVGINKNKRKINDDSSVEGYVMDIRCRIHNIVRTINPRTFANGMLIPKNYSG